MSSELAVSGERLRNAANRRQARRWPFCVPVESLRAFMSSIMRWRSGLIEHVVIGNSCLIEVETSIIRNPLEGLLEEIHWWLPPAARTVCPS